MTPDSEESPSLQDVLAQIRESVRSGLPHTNGAAEPAEHAPTDNNPQQYDPRQDESRQGESRRDESQDELLLVDEVPAPHADAQTDMTPATPAALRKMIVPLMQEWAEHNIPKIIAEVMAQNERAQK